MFLWFWRRVRTYAASKSVELDWFGVVHTRLTKQHLMIAGVPRWVPQIVWDEVHAGDFVQYREGVYVIKHYSGKVG